ncbi:MAG: HEAT repeat domain-containing protein [Deltaproteobacteria bacterium]|nr:HEAT repeat domain-containing protein [Deltaproteobacteria bacterium]
MKYRLRALAVVLFAIFVFQACGPKKGTIEYWIDQLDARKLSDRITAIQKITDLAENGSKDVLKAVKPLIEFYKNNTDERAREKAAVALGKIGDKSAVPDICKFLEESAKINQPKVNNRSRALAFALGEIGDPSAIDTLLKVVDDAGDESVKRTAITALGTLKAKKAVDKLIKILMDNGENLLTRQRALAALGKIRDPRAVDALVFSQYVVEKGMALYEYAAKALHELGRAAVPKLIETLQGKNKKVNDYIKLHPDWVKGVMEVKAIYSLGDLGDKRAVKPILALMDKNDFQVPGAMALGFLQSKEALPKLLELLNLAKNDKKKIKIQFGSVEAIADALVQIYDPDKVIPEMFNIVEWRMKNYADYYDTPRYHLMLTLSKLVRKKEADHWLELAEKDPDKDAKKWYDKEGKPRVLAAKECDQNYDCWVKKLDDPNPFVRERATFELGRSGNVKYLDPLINKSMADRTVCSSGYKRCEACPVEQSVCVREAAVDALLKLGPKDPKKAIAALDKRLEEDKSRSTFKKVGFRYETVRWLLANWPK